MYELYEAEAEVADVKDKWGYKAISTGRHQPSNAVPSDWLKKLLRRTKKKTLF